MSQESPPITRPEDDSRNSVSSASFPSIRGYEIIRELNRGGQGVVYQAIQLSTKRKVAIKLLIDGALASPAAQRRFLREIELAASLRHPSVVSVFDSGTTADSRQFCVMDYVRGKPVTDYVRENRLPLDQALRLFATICDAVAHAHQKGMIHRDLKPSNILVDSDGKAHILDFGLAKTMTDRFDAMMTQTGQLVGTVRYMSPEQTRGNPDEIDTRSDVYALGVILYETLTGCFPYPVDGALQDVLRHITSTEPMSPIRSWSKDRGVSSSTGRTARREGSPIDAELVTIVTKSLAKDRDHRYQSAGELGRDIGHYLEGEPIEASGDSAIYLLRKTLARHRGPVLAAMLIFLVAAVGLAVSAVAWRRAAADRDAERLQRQVAEANLIRANEQEQVSRLIVARAYAQEHQFTLARTMLESVDPHSSLAQDWHWAAWEFLRRSGELSSVDLNAGLDPAERMRPARDSNGRAWIDITGQHIWTIAGTAVHILEMETDRPILLPYGTTFSLPQFSNGIRDLSMHREGTKGGRHIVVDAVGSPDRTKSSVTLLKPDGTIAWKLVIPPPGLASSAALSDDGSLVALAMQTGAIEIRRILDNRSELLHTIEGVHDDVVAMAFDSSGQRLHIITGGWFHRIFTVSGDADVQKITNAHIDTVRRLAFDTTGRLIASGGYDGRVKVWDVRTGAMLAGYQAMEKSVYINGIVATSFLPDGRIVSSDYNGVLKIWDWHSGNITVCDTKFDNIGGITVSDDGQTCYSAGSNHIQRWNIESATPDGPIFGDDGPDTVENNYRVIWLQNKNRLIVLRSPGYRSTPRVDLIRCQIWDLQGPKLLRELRYHTDGLRDADLSQDGNMLAISSRDGTATLWDWQSGQLLHVLVASPGHSDSNIVSAVKFDPTEPVVATACHDCRVIFWSTQTGRQLAEINVDEQHQRGFGPTGMLKDIAFSPDGKTLAATVGNDIWWVDMGYFDQQISDLARGR